MVATGADSGKKGQGFTPFLFCEKKKIKKIKIVTKLLE